MNVKCAFRPVFLLFLLVAPAVFAQQKPAPDDGPPELVFAGDALPDYFRVGEITGRLGGAKALRLARPVFSDEARAKGVEGKVKVRIVIDEDGNVAEAEAEAGEPLLREAAVKAARLSRFSAPTVNGQKTRTEGHLNYEFAIARPNWFVVGYGLVFIEALPTGVTRKALAADWTAENAALDKLTEIILTTPEPPRPQFVTRTVEMSGTKIFSSQRVRSAGGPPAPPIEMTAGPVARELATLLQKRLAGDAVSLWQLNLGLELPRALGLHRFPAQRANAASILRQLVATAPPGIAPEILAELSRLIPIVEQPPPRYGVFSRGEAVDVHREFGKAVTLFAGKN